MSLIESIISVGTTTCSNCHCMTQGQHYYYHVDDDGDHNGDVLGEHDGLTPFDFFTCSVLSSLMGKSSTMNRRNVTDSTSPAPSTSKTTIDTGDINGIYPVKKPSQPTVSSTRKGNHHLLGISTNVHDDDECTHGRRRSSHRRRRSSSVNRQRSDSSSSTASTASSTSSSSSSHSTSSSSSHGQSLFEQQHRAMQTLQQQNQQRSPTSSSQRPTGIPILPPRLPAPQLLGAHNTPHMAARDSSIIIIPTFHQQHQYYHPRRREQLSSIMGNAQLLSLMEEDGDLDTVPTVLGGGGDPLLGQQPTSQSQRSSSLPTSSVNNDDFKKQQNLLQVHSSNQRQEEEGDSSSSWSSVFASMHHIFGSDVNTDVYDEGDDDHHHDVYTSSLPWLVSDLPFCWEIFGLNYHHYQTAATPSSTQSTAYPGTAATFSSTSTTVPEILVLEFPARTRHRIVRRQVIDSTPTGVGTTASTSTSARTTAVVATPTAWSHQSQSFLEWIFSSNSGNSCEASNSSLSVPSPSDTLMIQQGQPEEQHSSLISVPLLLSPSTLFHNVFGANTSSTLVGGATDASGEDEGNADDDNGSVASTATTATMDSASFCPSVEK